jgi:hypothetical protein
MSVHRVVHGVTERVVARTRARRAQYGDQHERYRRSP